MSDEELQKISTTIIRYRNELDSLNKLNAASMNDDEKAEIEVRKAKAKIGLRRAKQEYEDYIMDEVAKP